jgi:predicted DNA-binding transcriptional regulator YafY
VKADAFGPHRARIAVVVEHPVSRLLTLLELLQAHRRLGGGELARRLGVAPRTVRRYVATLQEAGIPVGAEVGRYGGYHLRPGYKLPPLMLTGDEALAVVLGLLAGRRAGLPAAASAVEGALAKIHRVLPDALRRQLEATRESVGWGLPPGPPDAAGEQVDAGVLLALAVAAHDRQRVRLSHRARTGETSSRLVDPYGIVFQGGRWYVAGRDQLRQSVRTFRADRVLAVEAAGQAPAPPAGFDAVAEVQRSIAGVPFAHTVEVLLEVAAADARRRFSPAFGTIEERPDGVLLRFGTDDPGWAAHYLAGLGCPFRVLGPAELREALARLGRELLAAAAG